MGEEDRQKHAAVPLILRTVEIFLSNLRDLRAIGKKAFGDTITPARAPRKRISSHANLTEKGEPIP